MVKSDHVPEAAAVPSGLTSKMDVTGSLPRHTITAEQEPELKEHLPMVHFLARRIHERLPHHVDIDVLFSAGVEGLREAIEKFDSTVYVDFRSFAKLRIRGAILETLRTFDKADPPAEEIGASNPYTEIDSAKQTEQSAAKLANYKALVARAVDVFGEERKASIWLSVPNESLGGKAPLQVAQETGYDPQSLEPLFTRIEHGIYA